MGRLTPVRRALAAAALLLAVASSFAPGVSAIHEDQVGSYDWHQQHLGVVQHAAFAGGKGAKRVFVSTDQGAIGALNLRTGGIAWRQVLEQGDVVDKLVIAGRMLVTLSSSGKYLRAWALKDGNLLWEVVTYSAAAPSADAAAEAERDRGVDLLPLGGDVDNDGAEDILVLARGEVQLRSLADGITSWMAEAANAFDHAHPIRLQRIARLGAAHFVAVGVSEEEGAPAAVEMRVADGHVTRKGVAGTGGLQGAIVVASKGKTARAAAMSHDGAKISVVDLDKLLAGRSAVTAAAPPAAAGAGPAPRLWPLRGADDDGDAASLETGAAKLCGKHSGAGCALVVLDPATGSIAIKRAWAGDGAAACPALSSPTKTTASGVVVAASHTTSAGAKTEVVSLEGGDVVFEDIVAGVDAARNGDVRRAFVDHYVRKGGDKVGTEGFRAVVATADAQVSLHQQGSAVWAREESLAAAGEVMFGRLPPPSSALTAAAAELAVQPSFEERLRIQVRRCRLNTSG